MSCDIKIEHIIFNIEKIWRLDKIYKEVYIFVGNVDDDTKNVLEKLENRKNIKSKQELEILKKKYSAYYKKWLDYLKNNTRIKFIYKKINLDDSIGDIKKKIFVYLSNIKNDNFILPENQELWLENYDKKNEIIGYYYENKQDQKILFKPCVYINPQEDKDFRIGVNYKINTSENNILIKDLLDLLNNQTNTLYLTDAKDEEIYIKSKYKNISNNLLQTYFRKHFPFYKKEYIIKNIKNIYIDLKNFFEKEEKFIDLYNKYNTKKTLESCNIINIQIYINTSNINKSENKNLDLYKIFDYLREKKLDSKTPFIKYSEDLLNVPVSIISKEALQENKIKKNTLKDWIIGTDITKKMNGITIKRYLKDYDDNPRYLSLSLKKNSEILLFIGFENKNNANFYDIMHGIKNCKKLIEDVNKNIITKKVNNIQKIEEPDMEIKNGNEILLKENTKVKFMTIMIPFKNEQNINFKELYEFSKKFPNYLYDETKDIDIRNRQDFENKIELRYKKVSGFTPMNKIIHEIDILKQKGKNDTSIIVYLQNEHQKSIEEATKYLLEWKKKYGSSKTQKIDPRYKLGIKIEINNTNIKLNGVTKIYLIPIIYKFVTIFLNLYLFDINFNKRNANYLINIALNNKYNHINNYQYNQYNKNISLNLINYNMINDLELDYNKDDLEISSDLYHNSNVNINSNANEEMNHTIKNNENNGIANISDIVPEARLKCDDAIPEKATCGDYCNDNSYFIRRLQMYDNNLFKPEKDKKSKKDKSSKYSIICQRKRQPIILSYDPEKKSNIKRDSYTYSIKYSTRQEYPRWYICSNIWCPICEIPISKSDISEKSISRRPTAGEGGVCITAKCPYGNHQVIIREEEQMIYPGFSEKNSIDGYCLPCCYNLPQNIPKSAKYKRFQKCLGIDVNNVNSKDGQIYILGKSSPLDNERYGLLPFHVAKLLNTKLETGYLNFEKGYLKKGIKQNSQSSFLSCILDIFSCDKNNMNININSLTQILVDKLDESLFRSLHAGNLQVLFHNSKINNTSMKNFQNYLQNKEIEINHTYLWDYLQRENILFENGINIFIFENNKIICPIGQNIKNFFDPNKKNILLLKTNNYYEPIYFLEGNGKKAIKKCIFEKDLIEIKKLYEISKEGCVNKFDIDWLEVLKKNIKKNNLLINNTNFTFDYDLYFVIEELLNAIKNNKLDKSFVPKIQYVDSYNKVFGLLLNNNLYIPIKPSHLLNKLSYKIILDYNDISKLSMLQNIKFLKLIYNNTSLKYSYESKILDLKNKKDIIALVNNNGRIIPITQIKNNDKTLQVSTLNYYNDLDEVIANNIIIHDKRIEKMNKKNFENETYNRMRYELSIFIHKNKKYLKEIKEIIFHENNNTNNNNKLNVNRKKMYKILNEIFSNITITKNNNIDYNYYNTPNKRIPCFIRNIKKVYKKNTPDTKNTKYDNILSCDDDPHCIVDKNSCKLYINKNNLLDIYNGVENYQYYLSKILDELLRYKIKREEILNNEIDDIINKQLIPENPSKYLLIKTLDIVEIDHKIEKIYFDNKGVFIDNRDLYEESTTKLYAFNKDYYLKKNINIINNYKNETLSIHWLKYLNDKFKINSLSDTLFNIIVKAINSSKTFYLKNKSLTVIDIKKEIIKNMLYLTKNKKNTNSLQDKIYNKYKECCPKNLLDKVKDFENLLIYINDINYGGCLIDIKFISKFYGINIIILDKRIKKNDKGFVLYLSNNSKYYILIYRSIILNEYLYNLIGVKNNFIFHENNLPPKFMNEIININNIK